MFWKRAVAKVRRTKFDHIIVGAGSAGCVLANRLSENRSKSVLLVEAGPKDTTLFNNDLGKLLKWQIHMPSALMYNLCHDKYNWFYHTVPQPNVNNREFYWPRGRVFGGSSSLNAMVYVRGHGFDQNRWARECGDPEWDYDHVLPYFKRAQNFQNGEDLYRGAGGPLEVSEGSINNPLYKAFIKAGVEAGYPESSDLNGFQQEGFGRLPMTVNSKAGMRWSAASAYLRPAMARENLTVLSQTLTDKIIFDGTTAKGLKISNFKNGAETEEIFGEEIILCGGAINSPSLLQLSGVGEPEHLKSVGIKPVVDLPGVGENLQDHLEVYVQQECKKPLTLYSAQQPHNMVRIGAQWFLTRKGICAGNQLHAGAFIRSRADPEIDHPDIQFHFLPSQVIDHGRKNPTIEAYQVHVGTLRAKSVGHLKIKSSDPREHPLIDPKYFNDPADLPDLVAAVKLTREIFAQKAFDEFRGPEVIPGSKYQSDKEISEWVKEACETAYHPSCSCKMGKESDQSAVVDSKCRVFGTQNLRVVDSSIMPSVASGNLNAPTIALAEKASDIIRDEPSLHLPNTPIYQADLTLQR